MEARDLALAEHYDTLEKQHHAARLGMWLFIASEVLFFAVLFTLYAAYRAHYREDFTAAAEHSDLLLGTINTFVLITSSLTMALAVHAARLVQPKTALLMLAITTALGVAFFVVKGTEYLHHFEEGIRPGIHYAFHELNTEGARMYFTLYYVTTGLHALHVLIGIGLIVWLMIRLRRRYTHPGYQLGVELVGVYWHLVDLIWIFLWPMYYLVR